MIPSVASVLSALLFGSGVFFPSPHDKSGWALRVHNFSVQGPYLVGESISEIRIRITLSNSAKNTQAVAALTDAKAAGDLRLKIVEPEGTALNTISGRKVRGVPIAPNQLRTSESSTLESPLIAYGYWMVLSTGKYSVQAKLKIDGESIQSP